MANVFFTGFENISAVSQIPANLTVGWDHNINSTTRFSSGKSLYAQSDIQFYLDTNNTSQSTFIMGGAYRFSNWANAEILMAFADKSDGQSHVTLRVINRSGNYGTLAVYGPTNNLLGTGTADAIILNNWNYIEMKATIDNSAGSVEVKLNGVTDISVSNVDTKNDGYSAYPNRFWFKYHTGLAYLDDLYLNDGSGTAPHNTFYGEVRVDAVLPSSDSSVQFTPSTSGSNYAMVDDGNSPDDDTTYNYSNTLNHKDLLGLSGYSLPPSSSGGVLGVNIDVRARRAEAGNRKMKNVAKSSTTEVTGSEYTLQTSYTGRRFSIYTDPSTGTAFANATAVNNLKVGYTIST